MNKRRFNCFKSINYTIQFSLALVFFILGYIRVSFAEPIKFTENKGQISDQNLLPRTDILFSGVINEIRFFIRKDGISYQFYKSISEAKIQLENEIEIDGVADPLAIAIDSFIVYRLDINWINPNTDFKIEYGEILDEYSNYYLATCPEGLTGLKSFESVTFRNLWNGIDIKWYEKNGQLEYDFIVNENADVEQIKWKIEGAEKLNIENERLVINTKFGKIVENCPIAFQEGKVVPVSWELKRNVVNFKLSGYQKNVKLIIDPVVRIWSTYYGGNFEEQGHGLAVDNANNVFIAGFSSSSNNIATTGAHQTSIASAPDGFLAKFDQNGNRLWATYFGGSDMEWTNGLALDNLGNPHVTGLTESATGIATVGSHKATISDPNYSDAFCIKFTSNGVRIWGTYIGGLDFDEGNCIAIDDSAYIFIGGRTRANSGIATPGVFQTTKNSTQMTAFITKFSPAGNQIWGSYYGPSRVTQIYSIAVKSQSEIYFAGILDTVINFSAATIGSYQFLHAGGGFDGFLAKFDASGNRTWSSYFGGSGSDWISSINIGAGSNVLISGGTSSAASIATPSAHQSSYAGNWDSFCAKFSNSGARIWSTYYGGSGEEGRHFKTTLTADDSLNIFLLGYSTSTNGIAYGNTIQSNYHGGHINGGDLFIAKLDSNGLRKWGTYYGSNKDEVPGAIEVDGFSKIYALGWTYSDSGLTSPGAHQTSFSGIKDALLLKLGDCVIDTSTLSVSACGSFTSPSGKYLYTNSGIYSDTIYNLEGCDSVITLIVTIDSIPPDPIPYNISGCDSGQYHIAVISPGYLPFWYFNANDSIPFDSGWSTFSPFIDSSMVIYVESKNTVGCVSARIPLYITINHSKLKEHSIDTCIEFTINGITLYKSDTVVFLNQNRFQCDSNINYYVNIREVDNTVDLNNRKLTSNANGAAYQWLDCDNGFAMVAGETNKSYTPLNPGYYAVEVTQNACIDTSKCIYVKGVGIKESLQKPINIFPIPAQEKLFVEFMKPIGYTRIRITNNLGQMIVDRGVDSIETAEIDVSQLVDGIYNIIIDSDSFYHCQMFIKN